LLVAYILPVCALLAPCHPGGAPSAAAALGTPGAALRDLRNESLLQDTRDPDPDPPYPLSLPGDEVRSVTRK